MQIPTPLKQTFEIPWGKEKFSITITQATGVEDDTLAAFERKVMNQKLVKEGDREYIETINWQPEKLMGEHVRLTLVDCDLEDDGKPLFRAGMNRADFAKSWGKLPVSIRGQVHAKVMEVNPDWVPFRGIAGTESEN